jgi:hypothetical protein
MNPLGQLLVFGALNVFGIVHIPFIVYAFLFLLNVFWYAHVQGTKKPPIKPEFKFIKYHRGVETYVRR